MNKSWESAIESLSQISITSSSNNEPVMIDGSSEDLRCVGVGTDAAVFQFLHAPEYAFKLYADSKFSKIEIEESVYDVLGDSTYFSKCYASYDKFLVLSYEEGVTLYDCLLQGIHVPEQVIVDVEKAREYVREKGLNPRDIHLKNILLQNGRAKIIDVSEYVQAGNDFRWEHLKSAYEYYHLIDGKSVPYWLLEAIRKWYNQWNKYAYTFDEFMKYVLRNTTFRK
ncbi:serine/threonine protein kinase [Aquibacillus saliphilus]|uniref:serine/threonine protein kinase n=1 Tax=Aquibacillus saliphilus TaxID=1909422 RepID=UPI001CEFDD7F